MELASRSPVRKIYRQSLPVDYSRPLVKTPSRFGVEPALTKGSGNGENMKMRLMANDLFGLKKKTLSRHMEAHKLPSRRK